MFYQNFKCKIFYINLLRLIWLTENILLQNKHRKTGKYVLENILQSNKQSGKHILHLLEKDNCASKHPKHI